MCGLDPTGSGQALTSGTYEDSDELVGSIKGTDCLGQLADYELLKNDRM